MESAKKAHFTQKDAERLVGLLNFVATHATFDKLKVQDVIEFYRTLNWAQVDLLPKIEANIFEITEVKQVPKKAAK